ncbi:copper chaperone PCu(A)C [Salinivibrio costicola]|uniref:Copper chaperone PCu(A)C n=1 Tax=Salinivibrio costicola TaxID=51367 RepID=A0ABX6KAT1_SALCS|nr:copper chaperone PCu(A)C [Salinivibrio costicola]QIR07446.1 copper chaperone PCu(A)C [Salinivibrio costicola]
MSFFRLFISAIALFTASFSHAHGEFFIHDAYARASAPGAPNSAAFMVLDNQSDVLKRVVSAQTPAAKRVELHEHAMADGMMKMRQIPQILVPSGEQVVLQPGGLHVMLFDLVKPLKVGEQISLTLTTADGHSLTKQIPVKSVMEGMQHHSDEGNHHHQ